MAPRIVIQVADWAIRRPLTALGLSVGLCLLAALPALGLHLDGDARRLLPDHDPAVRGFRDLVERFGASEQTVLAVTLDADLDSAGPDRQQLWAAVDEAGARVQALTWQNPTTGASETLVDGLTGLPDPARSAAVENLVAAETWLMLDDAGLDRVIRDLQPRRVERRLQLGGRPDTPPHLLDRDPLGLWTDVFLPFWSQQIPHDGPLHRREGHLVSADGHTAVLIMRPRHAAQDAAFAPFFANALEALLDDLRGDSRFAHCQFAAVGGHLVAAADYATARHAAFSTLLQGSLGILILFAVIFRNLRLVGFLAITLLPASLAALGMSRLLLGPELSLLVVAFAVVLIGLGVDFTIHLDAGCARGLALGRTRAEATRAAVNELAPAILAGAVTSIAAFAVLGLSNFPGLRELGLVAACGLTIMVLQVFVATPAYLSRWARPGRVGIRFGNVLGRVFGESRWPGLVIIVGALAVIVVAAVSGDGLVRFDGRARNLRPANDPLFARQQALAQRLGLGVDQVHLLVHAEGAETVLADGVICAQRLAAEHAVAGIVTGTLTAKLPARLEISGISDREGGVVLDTALGKIHGQAIREAAVIAPRWVGTRPLADRSAPAGSACTLRALAVLGDLELLTACTPDHQRHAMQRMASEVDWAALFALRSDAQETRWPRFWQDLERWQQRAMQGRCLTPDELLNSPLDAVVRSVWTRSEDEAWLALRFAIPDLGAGGLTSHDVATRLGFARDGEVAPHGAHVQLSGVPVLAEALATGLAADFRWLGGWSLALVMVILIIHLRGLRPALAALLALVMGGLLTQAALALGDVRWNLINVAALPLLFGLGIDGALYAVVALSRHAGDAAGRRAALSEIAAPLTMTTATTVVGFASLLTNPYRGLQSLGMVAITGMVVFLLVALVIPAALRRSRPR